MQYRTSTEFEEKVYQATSEVPRGRVTTYGLLARHLACGSPRAVGQALKRNPFAPRVPCHRVIASDLSLGGFLGQKGGSALDRKTALLEREGVKLIDGRLKDIERLYTFESGHGPAGLSALRGNIMRERSDG